MVGMLQIITYMLAFYMVLKGLEILQIGLASGRVNRRPMIIIGAVATVACVVAAVAFVGMQDEQAATVGSSMPSTDFPSF